MGAAPDEAVRKVVLPGATAWILSGLTSAVPDARIGATVCEMMLARRA